MTNDSPYQRCAVRFAVADLSSRGYLTDRCCGKNRIFDIIAWNKEQIIGLLIRTSRNRNLASYHEEIARISSLVQQCKTPGKSELWLYYPGGKTRYHILPGGAMLIREAGQ